MKRSWTQGLDGDVKKGIEDSFKSSALLRSRLQRLLEEKKDAKTKARYSEASYESPNWAYLQADLSGYSRAIDEVISLITEK